MSGWCAGSVLESLRRTLEYQGTAHWYGRLGRGIAWNGQGECEQRARASVCWVGAWVGMSGPWLGKGACCCRWHRVLPLGLLWRSAVGAQHCGAVAVHASAVDWTVCLGAHVLPACNVASAQGVMSAPRAAPGHAWLWAMPVAGGARQRHALPNVWFVPGCVGAWCPANAGPASLKRECTLPQDHRHLSLPLTASGAVFVPLSSTVSCSLNQGQSLSGRALAHDRVLSKTRPDEHVRMFLSTVMA